MSERRAALVLAMALGMAATSCALNDGGGTKLVVTFKRATEIQIEYLEVTWMNEGTVYSRPRRVPETGTLPDAEVLGNFEIRVREGAFDRTIVARGYADQVVVAEGAVVTAAIPDVSRTVTLTLFAGLLPDGDEDGIPQAVDNCPHEKNPAQEPCVTPPPDAGADGGDAGEEVDLAPPPPDVGSPPPPDAGPPDVNLPPDGPAVPTKLATGQPCVLNMDCESGRCPDARAGRFCASPGMVAVPAGPFQRGCLAKDTMCAMDERPSRTITLEGFEIDQTEVTQSAYDGCVRAGVCNAPTNFDPRARAMHPVTNVIWSMADAFCRWAGKRLPTEAEWEKAARGPDAFLYPWGDQAPTCSRAQYKTCGLAAAVPVQQLSGTSAHGAEDMAGNVSEWVSDWYSSGYYMTAPDTNPSGPATGTVHSRRGGGYDSTVPFLRTGARDSSERALFMTGLRCAKNLP